MRARISFSNLVLEKLCEALLGVCETRISNVSHGSLNPVATSSCMWYTSSFLTSSHLHASPTIGRVPQLLEISMANVHSSWCKLWLSWYSGSWFVIWERRQHNRWYSIKKRRRVLPRDCSDVSKRFSTPSLCQWSALYCTNFKNLIVDSDTMMDCAPATKPHSLRPSGIKNHVLVIRSMSAPPDSLTKLQTLFVHLLAKQALVACSAIRTLHVLGHDVCHTLHQPSHHGVLTGNVALQLAFQSQQMYPEHTLKQFHSIFHRAITLRLVRGGFDRNGTDLKAPHHLLLE